MVLPVCWMNPLTVSVRASRRPASMTMGALGLAQRRVGPPRPHRLAPCGTGSYTRTTGPGTAVI